MIWLLHKVSWRPLQLGLLLIALPVVLVENGLRYLIGVERLGYNTEQRHDTRLRAEARARYVERWIGVDQLGTGMAIGVIYTMAVYAVGRLAGAWSPLGMTMTLALAIVMLVSLVVVTLAWDRLLGTRRETESLLRRRYWQPTLPGL